jgi:hypothetical protein
MIDRQFSAHRIQGKADQWLPQRTAKGTLDDTAIQTAFNYVNKFI